MGEVISIEDRIKNSKRARAVERAWKVAKSIERDRDQLEALRWIEPKSIEGKGITRKIDFSSEFPEGLTYVTPLPMDISVVAPASKVVPGENLEIAWTMPLLTRMTETDYLLDPAVHSQIISGYFKSPSLRNTIDIVSFLPVPKADASEDEKFKPEFAVALEVYSDLDKPTNYFAAVAKYGNKVVRQFVTDSRNHLFILADPKNDTYFSADMLVDLSQEELSKTQENAGTLDIYVYRLTEGGMKLKLEDWKSLFDPIESYPENINSEIGTFYSLEAPSKVITLGTETKSPRVTRGITALPSIPRRPTPSPLNVPKEVGDVRLGEGTKGEAVNYSTLEGYVADTSFAIQPIRIRFLGIREGTYAAAKQALIDIVGQYKTG